MLARRAALRVVGEAAALTLRMHDPWAGQSGAPPGGLPGPQFLAMPPPDTVAASWGDPAGRPVAARVTGWSSAAPPVAPPFEFERWDDEALAELRDAHALERLVHPERTDYPSLLQASAWVSGRWPPGAAAPPMATYFDAREVLRRAARGEVFDCGTYAWTLIQVLAALGIHGRLVELERPDGLGHTVVEAWCDELGRWVVLDPYTGATYTSGGRPLSALELHRLRRAGREREVAIAIQPGVARPAGRPPDDPTEWLAYFDHFSVRMRNNVRSARYPRWHPQGNRIMSSFEWAGDGAGRPFMRHQVRDSAALYFDLATTALRWRWETPEGTGPAVLTVRLASCTPNFDSFVVSRDGIHWTATGETFRFVPRLARDTLRFASRNRGGRVGRTSWIALESRPAPARTARPPLAAAGGRP